MISSEIIGQRIYDLLIDKSLQQIDVVNYCKNKGCKCSEATLSDLINGRDKGYDYRTLQCIAEFLNVSLDYLVGNTDKLSTDVSIRSICEYVGLTDNAVEILHSGATEENVNYINEVINTACNSTYIFGLFKFIYHYLKSNQIEVRSSNDYLSFIDLIEDFDENQYDEINTLIYTLHESKNQSRISLGFIDKSFWENFFMMSIQNNLEYLKRDLEKNKK